MLAASAMLGLCSASKSPSTAADPAAALCPVRRSPAPLCAAWCTACQLAPREEEGGHVCRAPAGPQPGATAQRQAALASARAQRACPCCAAYLPCPAAAAAARDRPVTCIRHVRRWMEGARFANAPAAVGTAGLPQGQAHAQRAHSCSGRQRAHSCRSSPALPSRERCRAIVHLFLSCSCSRACQQRVLARRAQPSPLACTQPACTPPGHRHKALKRLTLRAAASRPRAQTASCAVCRPPRAAGRNRSATLS